MYNAHMIYSFKEGALEKGVSLWKEGIQHKINQAEGFIRVQLYTRENEMIAIGTWEDKCYAEAFMKTGIFKNLMNQFGEYLEKTPINQSYALRYFESKDSSSIY